MAEDPFDPNPALRAEIADAIAVIVPKIHGLQELTAIGGSLELKRGIAAQLEAQQTRHGRLMAVIEALDAVIDARNLLAATGYPSVLPVTMQHPTIDELKAEIVDLLAAVLIFEEEPQASELVVHLGSPGDKPAE